MINEFFKLPEERQNEIIRDRKTAELRKHGVSYAFDASDHLVTIGESEDYDSCEEFCISQIYKLGIYGFEKKTDYTLFDLFDEYDSDNDELWQDMVESSFSGYINEDY